jgi:signal transduction histidine kinase
MHTGQGINNIITRTKRIGGQVDVSSEKEKGTLVDLKFKINLLITH